MQFCDSHCHLESTRYDVDRDDVITRAKRSGVTMMITCGSDLATSEREGELAGAIHQAESFGSLVNQADAVPLQVYAAVGIHGHRAETALRRTSDLQSWSLDEVVFLRIAQLAANDHVVALGELGLDYHYEFSPRPVQQFVLARQLELANELNLPVILHNRDADNDTVRIVENAFRVRGVLHCFLGDADLADWAIARGLYLGVAGPITYPRMEQLATVLARVPRERLLIETDSPYLAPQTHRGKRNEPGWVTVIAEKLGQILGMSLEQVAEMTLANARVCFGV
jgi:TatD DNase family protein